MIRTSTCAYKSLRNVSFLENFAYTLHEWSFSNYKLLLEHTEDFFTFIKEIFHENRIEIFFMHYLPGEAFSLIVISSPISPKM